MDDELLPRLKRNRLPCPFAFVVAQDAAKERDTRVAVLWFPGQAALGSDREIVKMALAGCSMERACRNLAGHDSSRVNRGVVVMLL